MRKSTVERAFELAREGKCMTVQQIRQQLSIEGYAAIHSHLEGPTITQQLRSVMRESAVPSVDER